MQFLILGLGRLGNDLLEDFESKGHRVLGTRTRDWRLGEKLSQKIQRQLTKTHAVIITLPPQKELREGLLKLFSDHTELLACRVYLCNSISIYGAHPGEVDENTTPRPESERGQELLKLENQLTSLSDQLVSLRLGGLFSDERHPIHYLSGKSELLGAGEFLNGVHHKDIAQAILHLEQNQVPNQRVNIVWDQHPEKSSFYTKAAVELGLPVPHYSSSTRKNKKIVHSKVLQDSGFKFKHSLYL